MSESTISAERATSFGPFRLLPAQQLLLEDEAAVRLGSRALEILTALVERAGELVSRAELIARVWPNTFIDENTLRVHVAGLRKALGDGQPGRRYLANVPGRGYRFVAPVNLSEPEHPPVQWSAVTVRPHNLPVSLSRAVGRSEVIGSLSERLPRQRFVTIVGAGGIGKTTVALALAEMLLPAYADGVRFVDLAPVNDPLYVPSTLGSTLGLAVHFDGGIAQLTDFLRDKQMLIVLDSCEHLVDATAFLAERLLAGAPRVHILATSREPLRAEGERVHRLSPLRYPTASFDLTAAEAIAFPAVQLFVERAAANLDGFELVDTDAPIVSDICRRLGGIALAIELAAARVDAFGIRQLSVLLDDRFRILKHGKRTAQPRHQSLAAALDWSYEFLPEVERVVLRRLSVFVGAFTLESAIAVAGDDAADAVETLAGIVSKSLVSADVGGAVVYYRLPDSTRAYAMQKLVDNHELADCARRHAQHQLDLFKAINISWRTRSHAEWLHELGRKIDDFRAALNWAFSPTGDISVALSLIAVSGNGPALAPMAEAPEYIERALATRTGESTLTAREEARLLRGLAGAIMMTKGPHSFVGKHLRDALEIAEEINDPDERVQSLIALSVYRLNVGNYREAVALAERCLAVSYVGYRLIGACVAAFAFYCLGESASARRHVDSVINEHDLSAQSWLFLAYKLGADDVLSNLHWLHGFPDKAVRSIESSVELGAHAIPITRINTLVQAACPIALYIGDLAAAERWISMLRDLLARNPSPISNMHNRCLKGMLLVARGDTAGVALLESGIASLREANFAFLCTIYSAALAQALAAGGAITVARAAIDEAIEAAIGREERWCMPELLRIKGEILQLGGSADADGMAVECFQQALDLARRQGALSWGLRAATSLAKLWQRDGKTTEAHEQLAAVYNRFTEVFETSDLRTARTLMDELRGSSG